MDSKLTPGVRVKGKPGTENEGKTGTIKEVQWLGKNPMTPNVVLVLWDGKTENKMIDEGELDLI